MYFLTTFEQAVLEIEAVRRNLQTQVKVREILSSSKSPILNELRIFVPSTTKWRVYDHCSALTRLYAIYESFVERLICDYLNILPELYRYHELEDGFRAEHRIGVARVLQRLERRRYNRLSPEQIIEDYHHALSGNENYTILSESLLIHDQNLWMNVLGELFKRIGITDLERWVNRHPEMLDFIRNERGGLNTVDGELKSFVQYRNDVAHGVVVDNILSTDELLTYSSFVERFLSLLLQRINHHVISRKIQNKTAVEIGAVSEEHKNNIVVAKIVDTDLVIGDCLFFFTDCYCHYSKIENIRLDDVDVSEAKILDEREVGLKMTEKVKKRARIVKVIEGVCLA